MCGGTHVLLSCGIWSVAEGRGTWFGVLGGMYSCNSSNEFDGLLMVNHVLCFVCDLCDVCSSCYRL